MIVAHHHPASYAELGVSLSFYALAHETRLNRLAACFSALEAAGVVFA